MDVRRQHRGAKKLYDIMEPPRLERKGADSMVSYADLFSFALVIIGVITVVLMAISVAIAIYNIKK